MRKALRLTALMNLLFWGCLSWAVTPGEIKGTLTFTEWKSAKINESTERIRTLRGQLFELRKKHPDSPVLSQLQLDINQELWNLDVARDLSRRDYLLLYASASDSRLQQVASRMSAEEVGQFLESYIQSLKRPTSAAFPARHRLGQQGSGLSPSF